MVSIGHECYCSRGRPMHAWRKKIRGNIDVWVIVWLPEAELSNVYPKVYLEDFSIQEVLFKVYSACSPVQRVLNMFTCSMSTKYVHWFNKYSVCSLVQRLPQWYLRHCCSTSASELLLKNTQSMLVRQSH